MAPWPKVIYTSNCYAPAIQASANKFDSMIKHVKMKSYSGLPMSRDHRIRIFATPSVFVQILFHIKFLNLAGWLVLITLWMFICLSHLFSIQGTGALRAFPIYHLCVSTTRLVIHSKLRHLVPQLAVNEWKFNVLHMLSTYSSNPVFYQEC